MTVQLKVLSLNCWGIPWVSSNRRSRMRAIGAWLAAYDCDVACLQEVWTDADYEALRTACSTSLPHAHYFCSGVVGSGVCVLSRHALLDAFFHQWPVNGYMHKIQHGDWFGGKGVGVVVLRVHGLLVHVYSAHLHAEYDREKYAAHRVLQAYDTAQFVRLTGRAADAYVLAGDLNSEPDDLAYQLLMGAAGLRDACPPGQWATYDAPGNTYASGHPKRIDYVLWGGQAVCRVLHYEQPLPQKVPGTAHSYSDHEAVCAAIELRATVREKKCEAQPEPGHRDTLVASLRVLDEASASLRTDARLYLCACLLLCAALWAGYPEQVLLATGAAALLQVARVVVTALMLFTLIMATTWNRIESNAVRATQQAMRIELKQLAQAHVSITH